MSHCGGATATRRSLLRTGGVAALALSGCVPSLPGQGPAPAVFRLTPKTSFEQRPPPVAWTLAVAEPDAERALDTNRLAQVRDGLEVDYYAGAVWSDRAPALVQLTIVRSFAASGAIAAVGTDRDPLRADFLLRSSLRAFAIEVQAGRAGTARVRLAASLARLPRRQVVASETFDGSAAPAGPGLPGLAAAFDEALGQVLKRLVPWTLHAGETAGAV
jgi:cholesterol transport system auxiliary component